MQHESPCCCHSNTCLPWQLLSTRWTSIILTHCILLFKIRLCILLFKIRLCILQWDFKFFCGVWKPNSKSHLSAAWCLLLTPRHEPLQIKFICDFARHNHFYPLELFTKNLSEFSNFSMVFESQIPNPTSSQRDVCCLHHDTKKINKFSKFWVSVLSQTPQFFQTLNFLEFGFHSECLEH